MSTELNPAIAKKVLSVVDAGLCRGLGKPKRGQMCVEAAVCYALGEQHSDRPSCVGSTVRDYKVALNDQQWSSNQARANGLRRIAVCQLGSNEIDQRQFASECVIGIVKTWLPMGLPFSGEFCRACRTVKTYEEALAQLQKFEALFDMRYMIEWSEFSALNYGLEACLSCARPMVQLARDHYLQIGAGIGVDALHQCDCKGFDLWASLSSAERNRVATKKPRAKRTAAAKKSAGKKPAKKKSAKKTPAKKKPAKKKVSKKN